MIVVNNCLSRVPNNSSPPKIEALNSCFVRIGDTLRMILTSLRAPVALSTVTPCGLVKH